MKMGVTIKNGLGEEELVENMGPGRHLSEEVAFCAVT